MLAERGSFVLKAFAADDMWGAGTVGSAAGQERPVIAHWNGRSWLVTKLPAEGSLRAIDGAGPSDIWAGGTRDDPAQALLHHWDGSAWSPVVLPAEVHSLRVIEILSLASGWAFGMGADGPVVLHWDGSAWTLQPAPGLEWMADADVVADDDIWAVGGRQIWHWDGTEWSRSFEDPGEFVALRTVAALGPGIVWAGGYEWDPVYHFEYGLMLEWLGEEWLRRRPSPGATVYDLRATGPNDVWASGFYQSPEDDESFGTLEHWNGSEWVLEHHTALYGPSVSDFAYADGHRWAWAGKNALYNCAHVAVSDRGFVPRRNDLPLGGVARWGVDPQASSPHRLRDASELGLFDSGPLSPGALFTYRYPGAGTFAVTNAPTGARGRVSVSPKLSQRRALTVRVRTRVHGDASPLTSDIQMRRAGSPGFHMVARSVGAPYTDVEVDRVAGATYQFRSRLRKDDGEARSGWSPVSTIIVRGTTQLSLELDPNPAKVGQAVRISGRLDAMGGSPAGLRVDILIDFPGDGGLGAVVRTRKDGTFELPGDFTPEATGRYVVTTTFYGSEKFRRSRAEKVLLVR